VPKLSDDNIRAIIGARLSRSLDSADSELRGQRERALDFYYGRALGNEVDGRAQVVSKDVMDTIKWMMPSLMRALSGSEVFKFDPIGPQDIEQAKQESEHVRSVIWKKNPGYLLMYDWIKDSLMQKVGYAHYYWQDKEKLQFDVYESLTDDQLVMTLEGLQAQGEVKIMAATQSKEDSTWTIKVRQRKAKGCAKWEVYPPDEVIVDKDCAGDIKDARSVFNMRRGVTRGELVEAGFDRDRVRKLTSYSWRDQTEERLARDTVNESDDNEENRDSDWASEELRLLRCWTYLDEDDDGIAELRYMYLAGNDILVDEEAPEIPWESLAPDRIPHRHYGLSVYDVMEDLQRINTALKRGLLDNTYFTMNPRIAFDETAVNTKMLGVNRPGGHVAVQGPPANALFPLPVQPMQAAILPVIQHFETVRENRVGVGRMTMGLDADTLAQATKGAYMNAQTASAQLLEIMADIMAHSGIGSLYNSMRNLLMRHQYQPTQEQQGKKWVWINPADWPDRETMTVSPGAPSKEEVRNNLAMMATAQQQAAQIPGLVQPRNVYALASEMQSNLGFEGKAFFTDPDSPEYAQWQQQQAENAKNPPPDPYLQAEQMKAQQRAEESKTNAQLKAQQMGVDTALKIADLELKYSTDLAAPGIGAELGGANGSGGNSQSSARAGAPQRSPAG
jgi:hypothetical protein